MKIKSIEQQKKNKNRVSIYIDGQYYGSLTDEVYAISGFKKGAEFDEVKFERLKNNDELKAAFDKALSFLEKRPRSEHEVREKLKNKDFSDEAVESTIQKLKEYKYIDDSQFARMLLSDEKNVKFGSKRASMMRLKKSGIDDETVLAAIDGYTDEDERQNALIWAKKLAKRYKSEVDKNKIKQKIAAAMARRGFYWDSISRAVNDVLQDIDFSE